MTEIFTLENKIKQIIDELKGLCQTNGYQIKQVKKL